MKDSRCILCTHNKLEIVFHQRSLPLLQNMVYETEREAREAPGGEVELVKCNNCGFVYNRKYDESIVIFDENYQNEQDYSPYYQAYLMEIFDLLDSYEIRGKRVVEIACGKGRFLEILLKEGVNITGFDPAYEGNNPRIIKDYFSDKYSGLDAEVVIIRHALDMIYSPFDFVKQIAKANNYRGYFFAEVPAFDWVVAKNAYWDISYEVCNYFTENTLNIIFGKSETGRVFDGQYAYVWGDLSTLKNEIGTLAEKESFDFSFDDKIREWDRFLDQNGRIAVWGAGAKGGTFVNCMDPDRKRIQYMIDISPVKQNKFIAHTAHMVYSPEILKEAPIDTLLVMNENYEQEIREMVDDPSIRVLSL